MALRLSDLRRYAPLSPLSPLPSRPYAAGGRSGLGALGAVPGHQSELSAQVLARHHRPDRLPAAQGAAPQRARRSRLAGGAAAASFRRETRTAARCQCAAVCRIVARRRLVGLSAALAAP